MFEKMLEALNLSDDYDDDDYDDEDLNEEDNRGFFKKFSSEEEDSNKAVLNKPIERETRPQRQQNKITPMRGKTKGAAMEVCVIKPSSFEDAREISETLLAERTVLLNMKGVDVGVAQRIIDFTCGTCYAIQGNLQRVEDYIFIITPSGVELTGDLAGLVDAFDFTGIQTGF